ncbi:phenoloxidase-activating enzyme 1 [Drosophila rhopaloa]|uniref:Chymotrypsin-like protease CTRL-1 n=1 Tax=Drosophila rhopaloa TaxID=1041015 RepID=A0A6P4ESU2_DRORH|nr:phenoloxidase-activating enzyme 1 [Drosophila rhopaloa]
MKYILCLLVYLMFGNRVFPTSASLLEPNCGLSPIGKRISGGRNAKLNSTPWMAFLHADWKFICGGSLINSAFVVTAAHCVFPVAKQLMARLGEYDWTSEQDCVDGFGCVPPYRDYMVIKIYTHPRYRSIRAFDIALLKLDQPVQYTENIRPICVIMHENMFQWYWDVDAARELTLTGWGATKTRSSSPILQTVKLTQVPREICHDQHGFNVDHTHICAGDFHHYACTGDSGSPLGLTVKYKRKDVYALVGIVSKGSNPCSGVTAFTNVVSFTDWIANTISYDKKYMTPNGTQINV